MIACDDCFRSVLECAASFDDGEYGFDNDRESLNFEGGYDEW
jgi:hypothetical protein